MNSESDDTDDTNITTSFGLRQKPQPSSAHHLQAALPVYRPASSNASAAARGQTDSSKTSYSDFFAMASGPPSIWPAPPQPRSPSGLSLALR